MIENQLLEYIKSGFPIIQLRTLEYERAEQIIENVFKSLNKSVDAPDSYMLIKWNALKGIDYDSTDTGTTDPFIFLESILSIKNPIIAIAKNFDMILDDSRLPIQPNLIEAVLNFHKNGEIEGKHLIIVGNKTLPEELRSYIAVIDLPLPDKETIKSIVSKFASETLDIKLSSEEANDIARICAGMDSKEIINSVSIAVKRKNKKYEIDSRILMEEKAKIVKKSGLLEWIEVEETIDDIGGLENMKEWFIKTAKAFKNPELAEKYRLPCMKGAIIIGVSGTGKTLTAKVISKLFGVPLFRLDIGRLFEGIVGATEKNVRELFKLEDAVAPCVILIDEIEKALSGIESSGHTDSGITARVVGSYLYRLQEKKVNSFHVCTANNINLLPPELLRKGRFDEIWYVGLPNEEELEQIIKIHIRKVGRNVNKFDIPTIAKHMKKFTGAEVEATIKQAMYVAFYEDREFTTEDIVEVAKSTVPLYETKKEEIILLEKWATNRVRFASKPPAVTWAGQHRTMKK